MSSRPLTINQGLHLLKDIYGTPNDRLYSTLDLLYYHQKFLFRHIRSQKKEEAIKNLIISLSWYFAFLNRFKIDLAHEMLKRFPYKCPVCLDIPCTCDSKKPKYISKTGRPPSRIPYSIRSWQKLISKIFPINNEISGEDLLETQDRLAYSIRHFLNERKNKYFFDIQTLSADLFANYLKLANKMDIDLNNVLNDFFKNGCWVCHRAPCICNFYE